MQDKHPDKAVDLARQALEMAQHEANAARTAAALSTLASALELHGQYKESIVCAERALQLYTQADDRAEMAACAHILGWDYYNLGLYEEALRWALQGLAQAEAAQNALCQADLHNLIGTIYTLREDDEGLKLAVEHYRHSLHLYHQVGYGKKENVILNNIAMVHEYRKDYQQSLDYARQALDSSVEAGDVYGQILSLGNMAIAHRWLQQYPQALDCIQRRLDLLQDHSNPMLEAHTLLMLGRIHQNMGQSETALTILQQTLSKAEALGYARIVQMCHESLSEVYEYLGSLGLALQHYRAFHQIYIRLMNEESLAQISRLEAAYELKRVRESLIEERRQRQEERASYEALHQAQMNLLSAASHDIKSPLSTILLNVDLLERVLPKQEQALVHVGRLRRAANSIKDLVSQLLDKTLIESGYQLKFEAVDLANFMSLLHSDVANSAEEREIILTIQHSDKRVVMDATRMRQALRNLLNNAIKYTPNLGRVSLRQYSEGAEWVFDVQDNGIGIPQDDLPHLFTPFYRVKSPKHLQVEGTGLGLTIVKSIVDQHRGRVLVRSDDSGTLFSVRLPKPSA
ncbi:MAG: tetratricopeptide repeat-containing sensor histidine kinase [Anaerolineae bacterium]|nr:tetratricopeptide repeat-containing sensor histidine kinase [Anaerolineae bacterium]MDW8172356.1 tetratricopeptide repeat-containing sensor histidine kinase [Anaerolineae bacterium]